MTVAGVRGQFCEQRFEYRFDFEVLLRRNSLFGRWASELLGYSGEMSSLYAARIVTLLEEPPGRGMTIDDRVVSQVLVDLIDAGISIPPDELRAVLLEFEEEARRGAATSPGDLPRWSCPAHAQVVRSRPGTCPICGMKLMPVELGYRPPGTRAQS